MRNERRKHIKSVVALIPMRTRAWLGCIGIVAAASACGASLAEVPTGPPLPLPVGPLPITIPAWYGTAIGAKVLRLEASRGERFGNLVTRSFSCGNGEPAGRDSDEGWAQMDLAEGFGDPVASDTRPRVCIYYPEPSAPPRSLVRPRRLPSGVLEGEVWHFFFTEVKPIPSDAAFLLEDGVIIVAHGAAVAPTRAMLAARPSRPPPLGIPPDIERWKYSEWWGTPSLKWTHRDGSTGSATVFASEGAARSAAAQTARFTALLPSAHLERNWVSGTVWYSSAPPEGGRDAGAPTRSSRQ